MLKALTRVVATIGLIVAALAATLAFIFGPRLDAESKAFVDGTLPTIIGTWQEASLIERAAPELLMAAPPARLAEWFAVCSTHLGRLTHYEGARGEGTVHFHLFPWVWDIGGEYTADAQFEKGTGHINVRLVRRDFQWFYVFFYVNLPVSQPSLTNPL